MHKKKLYLCKVNSFLRYMKTLMNRIGLVIVLTTLLCMASCKKTAPVSQYNGETESPEEASQGMSPAEICTHMNDELTEDNEQSMFVTMFICRLNMKLNLFEYCNAGHNPPVIGNADGQLSFLDLEANAPIGLWPGLAFEGESIDYFKDRLLFIYTDGLNEAENKQQEQFGDERILELLKQTQSASAQQIIETLADAVNLHRNGADPNDDLTMMCIHMKTP